MKKNYRPVCKEPGWAAIIDREMQQDYMQNLLAFLSHRLQQGATIYPPDKDCFNAFNLTPLKEVKVVILGQDPYHGPGQAHGLCFSVMPEIPLPPSLKNIYRELQADVGITPPADGHLVPWQQHGVFLLNSVLTVEEGKPGAHQGKGWERLTDRVIAELNEHGEHVVFLLWGSYAQKKGSIVDRQRHLVLEAAHPSPLSAYRGFFGCKHFSQANAYLKKHGKEPVDWSI